MADAAQDVLSDPDAYHWREPAEFRRGRGVLEKLQKLIDSDNIAQTLSDDELGRLGQRALREYEIDEASRAEWKDANDTALKLAKQVVEEKNYPWPKASNVKYPLLTTAAIQFAARAYPAIINGPDVVKGKVRGKDDGIPSPATPPQGQGMAGGEPQMDRAGPPTPQGGAEGAAPDVSRETQWQVEPGSKKARAERVARHMSYQLLEEMEEWEEDTDKLLHVVPIVGCAFRKTYFDPGLKRNRSELVLAEDFVINASAKSIATAPRYTHIIPLYPHEIEERVRDGRFIRFEYGPAHEASDDEDAPHDFLEQHRLEDLDDDGYPEPYIVTVHKESGKVARIVACYDEQSVTLGDGDKVMKIQRTEYFTKYPFIPAFDGSFYDMGFGWLLRPLSEAINTSINQMIDAGHLANTGGGFIGSGLRIRGGDSRFRPGEYKRVISTGGSIKDNIVPMAWPGPSTTLFQLLGLLIEAARDITSVKDVMTGGEGPQNEAATRTLARIEQGMKVFSAIYKRLFRSLKSEFRKLFRLNSLYLEQETYFTFHDDPEAVGPQDYNQDDLDIAPVADPNMVTEVQRMAVAQFLMEFAMNDPYSDPVEVRRRIYAAAGVPDYEGILREQAPPDPELAQAADEIEVKKREAEIKAEKNQIDGQKMRAEAAKIKSEVILNLAKAEAESDKSEIEALKVLLDTILQSSGQDIERGKAADTREANEQKTDVERRRLSSVAKPSGNGGGS